MGCKSLLCEFQLFVWCRLNPREKAITPDFAESVQQILDNGVHACGEGPIRFKAVTSTKFAN